MSTVRRKEEMALSSDRGDSDYMLEKKFTVMVVKHCNRVPRELVGVTIPGGVEELSGSGAEQWLMV